MKPFILEQYATEYPAIRELQKEELELATGGCPLSCGANQILTVIFTPDGYAGEECDDR